MSPEFRLHLAGADGSIRVALYRPYTSELVWEADGKRISLDPVEFDFEPAVKRRAAFPLSPVNPAKKSKHIRTLKIQLGLKCNYTCQYCSQAHQPHDTQGSFDDVAEFLKNLPSWFESTDGEGVTIEFWGGEPFAYWKILKPLAEELRARYPKADFNVVTNGSLLDAEKVEWLERLGMGVGISHDGPAMKYRGPDPLKDPVKLAAIKLAYTTLRPKMLIGFNTVMHKHNMNVRAVQEHIASFLGVDPDEVPMSTEEVLLPYDAGGDRLSLKTEADKRSYLETVFWENVSGGGMNNNSLRDKIGRFFLGLAQGINADSLGQKCGMDNPHNLAVDLKGNAITCQNMSSDTKHRIGNVEAFEDIRLTTSYHWSVREECKNCPVLTLCQGACMFLEDDLWRQGCDNSFTHNLAMLATAMYWLTRYLLVEIEGPARRGGTMRLRVIEPPEESIK